ncbi:MAG: glutaminyl-peptide cyclotransferase, partial [Burkholderiales bacterium]|nr:glutaminyl-peptide cyclotransferase [Burkholderiales bacterium]
MKASSLIAGAILAGCAALAPVTHATPAGAATEAIPVYGVQVVRTTPHDINAFTEGLFFLNGWFYESTGLDGHSTVRKVKPETGQVVQRTNLPPDVFGEGIVPWKGNLIGLTWKGQVGYVFDLDSFEVKGKFGYPGEGWGLT